ncbi:hypothetical protein C8R46DRAFT_1146815 [Mycena filopes]|nr:hypothetical protein C8R46DRAFT_1146815 [Mycena filopes]
MLVSLLLFLFTCTWRIHATAPSHEEIVGDFFKNAPPGASTSNHTNNWAVLVCASRYWFNYRDGETVRHPRLEHYLDAGRTTLACNARNRFPGSVYANPGRGLDLYGDNIEVDYRGYEVTVENFIRVLTGRMEPSVPRSKRLLTDAHSNVFVYMTGHGGNEFLKFQDNEEINPLMIDTCQANTMYSKFYSPNILATGSAKLDQNSYSYENDNDIGVSFMEQINKTSHESMADLFASYDPAKIHSDPGVRADLFGRPLNEVRITDFFGGVAQVEVAERRPCQRQSIWTSEKSLVEKRPAAMWRTARAWGGVLLLGALVGWVGWEGSVG